MSDEYEPDDYAGFCPECGCQLTEDSDFDEEPYDDVVMGWAWVTWIRCTCCDYSKETSRSDVIPPDEMDFLKRCEP